MSKTMAINAGSSSLKFQLIEMPQETVVAKGLVERIGLDNLIFAIEYGDDQKFELVEEIATHDRAVELLFEHLTELGIVKDYHEITGAGHRVRAAAGQAGSQAHPGAAGQARWRGLLRAGPAPVRHRAQASASCSRQGRHLRRTDTTGRPVRPVALMGARIAGAFPCR